MRELLNETFTISSKSLKDEFTFIAKPIIIHIWKCKRKHLDCKTFLMCLLEKLDVDQFTFCSVLLSIILVRYWFFFSFCIHWPKQSLLTCEQRGFQKIITTDTKMNLGVFSTVSDVVYLYQHFSVSCFL